VVNQVRDPLFEDHWRVFDSVVEFTRDLVGENGRFELEYAGGSIGVFDVTPVNPNARPINVIAEQILIVTIGDEGGRFELDYTDEDVELARRLIEAAVTGLVEERSAFGRSRVTVRLPDGTTRTETGYSGCLSLLVPQPGWTRWGRRTSYEPYAPEPI
jgi:hypothetical protein